jgi:hypothetical protein
VASTYYILLIFILFFRYSSLWHLKYHAYSERVSILQLGIYRKAMVGLCVCVRDRKREREKKGRGRERKRKGKRYGEGWREGEGGKKEGDK